MESEVIETQTERRQPKSFSIESIIGSDARKSPEIDIENNLSENSRNSDEDDTERLDGLNRMRYYAPFLQNGVSFPFLLGYHEPWLSKMLGPGQTTEENREKRDSPVSVGSEESDAGEDNMQG